VKILHAIQTADPATGGPIEGVRQFAAAQRALGCTSEVVTLDAPDAPKGTELVPEPADAFPIHLPIHRLGPGHGGAYAWSPRFIPWLREHRHRFDVVVVNGLWQFHGAAVREALRGTDTPYVVFPHGMLDPWFKQRHPLKHWKKALYWRACEHRVLRDAAAVLFTAEEERQLARNTFTPYQCRELVVHHGCEGMPMEPEAARRAFEERFPELSGKELILYLGRIHEKKGADLLLSAFQHALRDAPHRPLHMVMAGPVGPDASAYAARLRAMAARLGIAERVTWAGMLQGPCKWGAFAAAELFALPSHQENFGIAVAEALSARLPVLISRQVNIWREIVDAGAGWAQADDEAGTIASLQAWLALEPEARSAVRARARACFESHFAIHHAARCFTEALETVVREAGKAPRF
jgi:glycosyltransferase involved in cell wall biosynthesis